MNPEDRNTKQKSSHNDKNYSFPIKRFCSATLSELLHNRTEMRFCYMLLVLQQVMAYNEGRHKIRQDNFSKKKKKAY